MNFEGEILASTFEHSIKMLQRENQALRKRIEQDRVAHALELRNVRKEFQLIQSERLYRQSEIDGMNGATVLRTHAVYKQNIGALESIIQAQDHEIQSLREKLENYQTMYHGRILHHEKFGAEIGSR